MKYMKRKGTQWERDAAEILNKLYPGTWKRIVMSGAAGTILGISELKPDDVGKYDHIRRKLAAEAKVGYGGAKQMAVKREWFEKIGSQAEEMYAIPMLLCKFSGSRSDVKHFVAMTFEAWNDLMSEFDFLYQENLKLWEKLEKKSSPNGND